MAVRIGELLLKEKTHHARAAQEALNYQRQRWGQARLQSGQARVRPRRRKSTAILSKQYGVPSIDLGQFEIDPSVIKLIPAETAQKYQIVPLSRAAPA
jgi:type IV pilus assembly protein PilB